MCESILRMQNRLFCLQWQMKREEFDDKQKDQDFLDEMGKEETLDTEELVTDSGKELKLKGSRLTRKDE